MKIKKPQGIQQFGPNSLLLDTTELRSVIVTGNTIYSFISVTQKVLFSLPGRKCLKEKKI